jgi:hypothetical protein
MRTTYPRQTPLRGGCGCSSVVEHNLAKVGVGGSNPLARSRINERAAEYRGLLHPANRCRVEEEIDGSNA